MTREEVRVLGQIEGKIDSLIVDVKTVRKVSDSKIGDLSSRVSSLEKKQYSILVISSLLFTIGLSLIRKFL